MVKRAKKFLFYLFCIYLLFMGGWAYVDRMKVDNLYRHGFRLFEEQIATYLKENYSGISKIEFSPIFRTGGGMEGFVNVEVTPVVYDNYGNKVYLRNGDIADIPVRKYGTLSGIDLDFAYVGSEIIYLYNASYKSFSVEDYQELPEYLKLPRDTFTDEAMEAFSSKGYLKGVEKNDQGSPEAEIVYNLRVRRVDVREIHKWKIDKWK